MNIHLYKYIFVLLQKRVRIIVYGHLSMTSSPPDDIVALCLVPECARACMCVGVSMCLCVCVCLEILAAYV